MFVFLKYHITYSYELKNQKVKSTLSTLRKHVERESRDIVSLILVYGASGKWVVNLTPCPERFTSRNEPRTH